MNLYCNTHFLNSPSSRFDRVFRSSATKDLVLRSCFSFSSIRVKFLLVLRGRWKRRYPKLPKKIISAVLNETGESKEIYYNFGTPSDDKTSTFRHIPGFRKWERVTMEPCLYYAFFFFVLILWLHREPNWVSSNSMLEAISFFWEKSHSRNWFLFLWSLSSHS